MAHITIHAEGATPNVDIKQIPNHPPGQTRKNFFSVGLNIPGGDRVSIFLDTYEQVVDLRDQFDQALTELTNDLELDKHGR